MGALINRGLSPHEKIPSRRMLSVRGPKCGCASGIDCFQKVLFPVHCLRTKEMRKEVDEGFSFDARKGGRGTWIKMRV